MKVEKILSINLKRIRKEKGFSNAEMLAEFLGVSYPTIATIESMSTWPRKETLDLIANGLGISEAELFREPDRQVTLPEALLSITNAINMIDSVPADVIPGIQRINWSNPNALKTFANFVKHFSNSEASTKKKA